MPIGSPPYVPNRTNHTQPDPNLRPLVGEAARPRELPAGPVSVQLDGVEFRYPSADEVSLRSLESTGSGDRLSGGQVLSGVTVTAQPGRLVALVGPSGTGTTTITALVARLYDPTAEWSGLAGWTCARRAWPLSTGWSGW